MTSADAALLVAEALGREAVESLGAGDDGEVWRLDDGRVLKLTGAPEEAAAYMAIAWAIAQTRARGIAAHPGIPGVHGIHRLGTPLEVGAFAGVRDAWAIVRDDVDPEALAGRVEAVECRETEGWQRLPTWEDLLVDLNLAAFSPEAIARLAAEAEEAGLEAEFEGVVSVLRWLERETGILAVDILPENFGITAAGAIGPLDLGKARVPARWRALAAALEPLALGAHEPAPRPR